MCGVSSDGATNAWSHSAAKSAPFAPVKAYGQAGFRLQGFKEWLLLVLLDKAGGQGLTHNPQFHRVFCHRRCADNTGTQYCGQ
jgi:hypothetical protein